MTFTVETVKGYETIYADDYIFLKSIVKFFKISNGKKKIIKIFILANLISVTPN
jgi:hypothetical protein